MGDHRFDHNFGITTCPQWTNPGLSLIRAQYSMTVSSTSNHLTQEELVLHKN